MLSAFPAPVAILNSTVEAATAKASRINRSPSTAVFVSSGTRRVGPGWPTGQGIVPDCLLGSRSPGLLSAGVREVSKP